MKFKQKSGLLLLLTSSMLLGNLSFFYTNETVKANAEALSQSSLPTTLDLNDLNVSDIRGYYSDLTSKTEDELRGTNLLKNLKPILRNNFQYFDYDAVWRIYEITDRDWSLSPAESSKATYDSASNTLSSYTYGNGVTYVSGDNPYVRALYRDQSSENRKIRAWDAHDTSHGYPDNGYINREHVWPKSYGFKTNYEDGPAGTDVHHLMAADGPVNSALHNNYLYGYVDENNIQSYGDSARATEANLRGSSIHPEITSCKSGVFEPIDSQKGDIARALFYMCAMYNCYDGTEPTTNDPFLELSSDDVYSSSEYSSSLTNPGKYGILEDLLEWNELDPVDEFEKHRNNLIYNNYQHNRNPFVDFPEWANLIWGSNSDNKYANPNTDSIGGSSSSDYVYLSSKKVTLSSNLTSVSKTITATSNLDSFTWNVDDSNNILNYSISSDNKSITVSPKGTTGSATITVTAGDASTKCTITVTDDIVLSASSISLNPGESATISSSESVTWSVSNPSIKLSSTSGNEVTITSPKLRDDLTTTLTATSGTKTATCSVTVLKDENIDASAQIIFPSNKSDKDGTGGISEWKTDDYPFISGYNYISSSSFTNVYYGKNGYGLKIGKDGTNGNGILSLVLNLDNLQNLNLASIDIYSSSWTGSSGTDETVFNINLYCNSDDTDAVKSATIAPSEGGTISLDNPASISKIEIATSSSKSGTRAYLLGFTLNFYSVDNFAEDFLNGISDSCAYSEENNWVDVSEKLAPIWPTLNAKYNYLNSTQQNNIKETISSEVEDATNIQIAMAKYDHIIVRYKSNDINDFIERNPLGKSFAIFKKSNNNVAMILFLLALPISVSVIGYFAFFRRKKTN